MNRERLQPENRITPRPETEGTLSKRPAASEVLLGTIYRINEPNSDHHDTRWIAVSCAGVAAWILVEQRTPIELSVEERAELVRVLLAEQDRIGDLLDGPLARLIVESRDLAARNATQRLVDAKLKILDSLLDRLGHKPQLDPIQEYLRSRKTTR